MTFNYKDFLADVGIEKGDTLEVASDLVSIMLYCQSRKIDFDPNLLIDAIVDYVGAHGTVAIRAFNWDFCKGIPFDIKKTPSKVGALGNVALKRSDFKRSQHPLYSWMVKGNLQDELCNLANEEPFGKGTPFDTFYKNNGKLLVIGNADRTGLTQCHDAEKLAEVPYRKEKKFTGEYYDYENNVYTRKYSMFVRPLNVSVTYELIECDAFEQMCIEKSLEKRKLYDGVLRCKTFKIKETTDFLVEDLTENAGRNVVKINGIAGYLHDGWDAKTAQY